MNFEDLDQKRRDMISLMDRGHKCIYAYKDNFYISVGPDNLIDITSDIINFIDFLAIETLGDINIADFISRDIGVDIEVERLYSFDKIKRKTSVGDKNE